MYSYKEFINEIQVNINNIRKYRIFFNNYEESADICKTLISIGYKVYNSSGILRGEHLRIWNCFKSTNSDDDFTRSTCDKQNDGYDLSYEDFMKNFGNKKYTKITNLEADPYGEDEWGYLETQNENRKIGKKEFVLYSAIHFNTDAEMIDIAIKLHKMGFGVKNYENIIYKSSPKKDYGCFVYFEKTNNFSRIKGFPKSVDKQYTYRQFVRIFNSKHIEEIQVPNLDPYNEEDWGLTFIEEEPVVKKPASNKKVYPPISKPYYLPTRKKILKKKKPDVQ